MEMWRRRGEATSAGLSAAPYSVYHSLYSEAVVFSIASAVALAEVGRFRETVEYVQKAAKALYETAKDVFEQVKITVQRLVELFVEAVARVLAWVDEYKAYLFLMAAVTAGAVALNMALDMWGKIELEKLVHFAMGAPFVAGLVDTGGRAAERFKAVAERWKVDDNEKKQKIEGIIKEIINAHLSGGRPYDALLELSKSGNLPPPLVKLKEALENVKDEVVQDAAVVAVLVLYKTLVKNAGVYREWAELYHWARSLVEKQEFTVAANKIRELREAHRRLEEVAEEMRRELNAVLASYASHSRDLYEKLRPHLEVDIEKAEGLAEADNKRLPDYSDANMGTKAYAALLSVARGGIYGHIAMLFMGEGALADIVMLKPTSAHWKAKEIAKGRGEAVDPSYSSRRERSVGQPSWEDRAASVLLRFLIGYGEADLKFRHVEKGGRKGRVERGFQVFRIYGGVETPVGELWIGKSTARFKVSEEELRHRVEEAKRTAPDLSGLDKAPQYLEWCTTDMTTSKGRIEASTAHLWQLRWYFSLLGEPKWFGGGTNVTEEGFKPNISAQWLREMENQILRESRWLESLLGRRVESWRELVDAIDWSWVVERVEELADEVKPRIGPEKMSDVEREGLARGMLGELALLAHFAEARRGMDDSEWRGERAKRLAKAVEALSGGRIADEYAERLAKQIIYYAENRTERLKKRIENLAEEVGVSKEEVWGIVDFILSDMYCLARDCARDAVVRKFVAPALELIMLDKALNDNDESNRERAKLIFGEMYATAVAGDGTVGPDKVSLAVGGELGGGAALLRLATLHLLNELLSKELKFEVRVYVGEGVYNVAAYGEDATRFMRLLAVSAPSAGGGYLSPKFEEFMKEARVEVRPGDVKLTKKRRVAADLTISEAGITVKYNIYPSRKTILLHFSSTNRSRVELAARLLRLAGVDTEVVKNMKSNRDQWQIMATTGMLAAGREELRKALAEIVRKAMKNEGVNTNTAERWLKKLEKGRVLKEGWPKYSVGLSGNGALVVRFSSLNPKSIEREKQWPEKMGLVEGKHYTVKMPEGGKAGYVYILKEGLMYAAWLSAHGSGEQQRVADKFVKYILKKAKDAGGEVRKKVEEIVKKGKERDSQTLNEFEKKVEVNGREHVVKVISWSAEFDVSRSGRKLLRIKITAEVDGVKSDYTTTFGRYWKHNAILSTAYARGDTPEAKEADAERYSALIKALTGREPKVYRMKDGRIKIECYEGHLEGFMRYAELADVIERWLEETGR
jgi:hypothetical protein